LWLSGDHVSDMSDAAGTLWLDVAARDWSDEMLAATGLDRSQMPALIEGTAASGRLRLALTRRWGMKSAPSIAGGGGDNAASACGIGAVRPGDGFISIGTSGVIFVSSDGYRPNTDGAVHTFCHAIPRTWHQMGVILSAGSSFDWLAAATRSRVADLFRDLDSTADGPGDVVFLPYLSGERTPHNDATMRGAFIGLAHGSDRAALSRAVAEGVGFAFRDCLKALAEAGTHLDALTAVGGGSRSAAWLQALADILEVRIDLPEDGDRGAAFGAARLGLIAADGGSVVDVCRPPRIVKSFAPDASRAQNYRQAWRRYRAMYPALKEALAA
jgi:xylulokinase